MRPDLLPPEYIDELSKLLDDVPGFDSAVAIAIIEHELGQSIGALFEDFEKEPVAAASFAQVHRARLLSGGLVAVKVQRPNLERVVDTDIRLMVFLAKVIDLSGIMNRVRVSPIVDDFANWTREELNFLTEATYAERLRQSSIDSPSQYIPRIYWDYTTRRVLTLEFLEGFWVSEILVAIEEGDLVFLNQLAKQGVDRSEVARNIFENGLTQVFDYGIFHADPHAGNLVILDSNRIGYVDFGIVGQADEEFLAIQVSLLTALEEGKLDRYARAVIRLLNPPPENIDLSVFEGSVKQNARMWQNARFNPRASLRERSSSWLFTRNLMAARESGLSFSELSVRYYRAITVAELIVLRLDPAFDVRAGLRDFFTQLRIKTILNDTTPAAYFGNYLRYRLLLRELPDAIASGTDFLRFETPSVRATVSNVRRTLSGVFRTLYSVGIVLLGLVIVLRFLFPELYMQLIPVHWLLIAGPLIVLIPFWAWLSQRLYITSVRPEVVRENGRLR